MEKMNWSVWSDRKYLVRMLECTQANHGHSPVHVQCFSSLKEGEQTIVTSLNDITMFSHVSGRGYIRKVHMNLGAVVWVFGTHHFSQLLGGH